MEWETVMFKRQRKIIPYLCVCTQNEKSRGKGWSQCPPGRQDDTVPLGAQAQNPQHRQHPLAEHSYSAASIHAWARWKLLAQVCATSSKEGCSPLQLFGTHMGSFTLSADKTSGITVPCPKPRGSFREHSLKGSLRSHSLRSLFSTRPVTKIIGLSREDTKTHWAKAIPSPNSLWFTVSCSNMPVESLQVIRVSNTLIVTPTLDQSKLVTPPLLQHDSTGVLSADPEETLHQWCSRTTTKPNWTLDLLAQKTLQECRHSIWKNNFLLLHLLPSSKANLVGKKENKRKERRQLEEGTFCAEQKQYIQKEIMQWQETEVSAQNHVLL